MNEYYLKKFTPYIYLHKDEKIQPMSFENYIENCELLINGVVVLKKNEIKLPLNNNLNQQSNKYLNFKGEHKIPNKNEINNIPLYGKVNKIDKNYIDIIYMLFFPINTGYNICNINIGYHCADLECIILRVNTNNELIENVYLSAHRDIECQNYNYKKIKYFLNKERINPIIYCSLGSHTLYPSENTYFRICGFVNDNTNEGICWHSNNIINLDERKDILSFNGKLGIDLNNEPSVSDFNRKYLTQKNNFKKKNISKIKKFFLCCFQ